MAIINIRCRKCSSIFDSNVGKITFPKDGQRPIFENDIVCPKCGVISIDKIFLTETGQTQLTQLHMSALLKK